MKLYKVTNENGEFLGTYYAKNENAAIAAHVRAQGIYVSTFKSHAPRKPQILKASEIA